MGQPDVLKGEAPGAAAGLGDVDAPGRRLGLDLLGVSGACRRQDKADDEEDGRHGVDARHLDTKVFSDRWMVWLDACGGWNLSI